MKRTNTQLERQMDIDRRIRERKFPSVPFLSTEWEVDERNLFLDDLANQAYQLVITKQ